MISPELIARLSETRALLDVGREVAPVTVRELIGWFGAERRGAKVAWEVRDTLREYGLITEPDFEGVHLDADVQFLQGSNSSGDAASASAPQAQSVNEPAALYVVGGTAPDYESAGPVDPAFRVSRLVLPNSPPLSVTPDCTLTQAVTLMLQYDYSQLPVMTSPRDVKGIVSWESIGIRLSLGSGTAARVGECMRPHFEVREEDSLFRVIDYIVENSYVLVRARDRSISAIITTSDLSLKF